MLNQWLIEVVNSLLLVLPELGNQSWERRQRRDATHIEDASTCQPFTLCPRSQRRRRRLTSWQY